MLTLTFRASAGLQRADLTECRLQFVDQQIDDMRSIGTQRAEPKESLRQRRMGSERDARESPCRCGPEVKHVARFADGFGDAGAIIGAQCSSDRRHVDTRILRASSPDLCVPDATAPSR